MFILFFTDTKSFLFLAGAQEFTKDKSTPEFTKAEPTPTLTEDEHKHLSILDPWPSDGMLLVLLITTSAWSWIASPCYTIFVFPIFRAHYHKIFTLLR